MQNYPEAQDIRTQINRGGLTGRDYPTPEEALDVQSGSLRACHGRTLAKLNALQHNTEMLSTILYKIDGARPPTNEIGKVLKSTNADKEPDHPTFTARKIEQLLDSEIDTQRAIMDQISRLIG